MAWNTIVVLTVLTCLGTAINPGIKASFPLSTLNTLRDASIPVLFESIAGMTFPTITQAYDNFLLPAAVVSISNLKITHISAGNQTRSVVLAPPDTFIYHFSSLNLGITFTWTSQSWINSQGIGSAWVNNTSISVVTRFPQGVPGVFIQQQTPNVTIDIVDIRLTGSGMSWLYNLVLDLFNTRITAQIQLAVQRCAEGIAGRLISMVDGRAAIPLNRTGVGLDARLVSKVEVFTDRVKVEIRGRFMNVSLGEFVGMPTEAKPFYYMGVPALDMFEIAISEDVLQSGLLAAYYTDQLSWSLFPSMLSTFSPLSLNTAFLDQFFPGLLSAFGPKSVYLRCQVESPPLLSVQYSGISTVFHTKCALRIVAVPIDIVSMRGRIYLAASLFTQDETLRVSLDAARVLSMNGFLEYMNATISLSALTQVANLALAMALPRPGAGIRPQIPLFRYVETRGLAVTNWDGFVVVMAKAVARRL